MGKFFWKCTNSATRKISKKMSTRNEVKLWYFTTETKEMYFFKIEVLYHKKNSNAKEYSEPCQSYKMKHLAVNYFHKTHHLKSSRYTSAKADFLSVLYFFLFEWNTDIYKQQAYLEPHQISTIELFCKNSLPL